MNVSKYHQFIEDLKNSDAYWCDLAKFEVAGEINALMQDAGISRKELANRIGVSQAYISKALRGDANLTLETIVKIARAIDARAHFHFARANDSVRWFGVTHRAKAAQPARTMPRDAPLTPVLVTVTNGGGESAAA